MDAPAMGFGIIGCGSIAAGSFAPSLLRSRVARLAAVCRRDLEQARQFAARFDGCPAYATAEELLHDGSVQAVIVSTPTDTHAEYTCLAASHGKHVLVEKPMGRSAAECRRMIQACSEAGVTLGVAYRRRLFPQVVRAQEIIAAGGIGGLVCVRTHYSGLMEAAPGNWRVEPGIGGAMMEMAVHRLEVLLNFGGRPAAVSALVETVRHDWPVDDSDAILVRFTDGLIGMHSTILTSPPRRDQAIVDGTLGRIIIDPLEFHTDRLVLETPQGTEEIRVTPLESPYFDLPMLEDFVCAARQGSQPVCDGITGYWVQATVDAAFRAARERRTVDVEPW